MPVQRRRQCRRACGRFRRQPPLRHPMHIQRIDLAYRLRTRASASFVAPGVAQQRRLQRQRPHVLCVRHPARRCIRNQRRVRIPPRRGDLRHLKVARRPPCPVPRRLGELGVRLIQLALRLQRQPQVVDRLAVLGRCVAGRVPLQRLAQIRFSASAYRPPLIASMPSTVFTRISPGSRRSASFQYGSACATRRRRSRRWNCSIRSPIRYSSSLVLTSAGAGDCHHRSASAPASAGSANRPPVPCRPPDSDARRSCSSAPAGTGTCFTYGLPGLIAIRLRQQRLILQLQHHRWPPAAPGSR